jgi:hypothetical protein
MSEPCPLPDAILSRNHSAKEAHMASVSGVHLTVNTFHLEDAAHQLLNAQAGVPDKGLKSGSFPVAGLGASSVEAGFGDPATGASFEQSITELDQSIAQIRIAIGNFAQALMSAGEEYTKVDVTAMRS